MSDTEDFEAKIERFSQFKSCGGHFRFEMQMSPPPMLGPEEARKYAEELPLMRERKFMEMCLSLTNEVFNELRRGGGTFSLPIPTLNECMRQARGLTLQGLKKEIESRNIDIEDTQEVLEILENLNAQAEDPHSRGIEIVGVNFSKTLHPVDYDLFIEKNKEKIEIIKEAMSWHKKVREVFAEELQKRKGQTANIISEKLKEASELCKEARKLYSRIHEFAKRLHKDFTQHQEFTDYKTAKTFVESRKRLYAMETRYLQIREELCNVVHFEEVKSQFPRLPKAVSEEDFSRSRTIEEFVKKRKKECELQKSREQYLKEREAFR